MNIYRIYTQGSDIGGSHTAIYYDEDRATKYFKAVKAKYPDGYIVTEVVDDETGNVLRQKEFGDCLGLTTDEVKWMRQECVQLIRYDIQWKEEKVIKQHITPDEAGEEMIAATLEDGYGTEWIYITRHDVLE